MAGATERGIVYPTSGDTITPLETAFATLAQTADDAITELEPQTVQVFENTADRDAASVPEGSFCFVKNIDKPFYYDGTNWIAFLPSSLPASVISSGVFDPGRIPTNINITGNAATATTSSSAAYATNAGSVDWTSITSKPATFPPPTITGSMIGSNTITQGNIAADSIGTSELQDGSVAAANIEDGAVTNSKIGAGAVTISKITDGAQFNIVNDKLIAGDGISKTGSTIVTIYADYGTASTQIPRGNHTHTVSNVGNGTLTRTTSVPSTAKVKKDIEPYQPTNIKNLLNLEPKTYKYKRSERMAHQSLNKEVMHGYIVEELLNLGFAEPVGYGEDGLPNSLDYGLMSMLVLELVKVQQSEIDNLKDEIEKLKEGK